MEISGTYVCVAFHGHKESRIADQRRCNFWPLSDCRMLSADGEGLLEYFMAAQMWDIFCLQWAPVTLACIFGRE